MGHREEHGDCLDLLRGTEDESIEAVVCDPPYGLSEIEAGDVVAALRCWLEGKPYKSKKKGMMGREWDSFVPGPEVWKECFRVLKPGGHLLAFAGTRTMDLMGLSIRLAGLEMRDSIGCDGIVRWNHGSGFPKSLDVSKAIDKKAGATRKTVRKRAYGDGHIQNSAETIGYGGSDPSADTRLVTAPATEDAEEWDGWGTALKPSWEPVLVFRKPFDCTVAENVLKHGTGGLNIDGCRVGLASTENADALAARSGGSRGFRKDGYVGGAEDGGLPPGWDNSAGRFAPNTLLIHHPDCRKMGTVEVDGGAGTFCSHWPEPCRGHGDAGKSQSGATKHGPPPPGWTPGSGTRETIDAWDCVDGCRVKMMGEKSGEQKDGVAVRRNGGGQNIFGGLNADASKTHIVREDAGYGGVGTAARFFPQFQYEMDDFYYCGKASKADRGVGNTHISVKPTALMQWLCRLVCQKGGTILDPFLGSGTTGVAALREGFNFIGFELDEEYLEIARDRIAREGRKGFQLTMGVPAGTVKPRR